MNVDIG